MNIYNRRITTASISILVILGVTGCTSLDTPKACAEISSTLKSATGNAIGMEKDFHKQIESYEVAADVVEKWEKTAEKIADPTLSEHLTILSEQYGIGARLLFNGDTADISKYSASTYDNAEEAIVEICESAI